MNVSYHENVQRTIFQKLFITLSTFFKNVLTHKTLLFQKRFHNVSHRISLDGPDNMYITFNKNVHGTLPENVFIKERSYIK